MKFLRYIAISAFLFVAAVSCEKKTENQWKIEVKNPVKSVEIIDISKDFYNRAVNLAGFKQKYPWFQGTVPDEDFAKRRLDPQEIQVYRDAVSKLDQNKLNTELSSLFSHIRNYFPKFPVPKVYLYSSALEAIDDPIFYQPSENLLFIDISGFMGENNPHYKGYEKYLQSSMNQQNIVPKVSRIFARNIVPQVSKSNKFIDQIVLQGKVMTLQDAFLPDTPDYLKMDYTQKQYDWAVANEANIWNYFVENNLIFSDDTHLAERFIAVGPFSKFYTEIDNQSSPQVGIFAGWQICRKFFQKKPETKLLDFLKMDATTIFNESEYKPK